LYALGLTTLMVLFLVTRAHFWAWRPKTRMTSRQPALLIRPTTTPSPADVGYYNLPPKGARRTRRHNRTASEVGSDTKCNSPAQPAIYYSMWALLPSRFCSWWHPFLRLRPQNTYDKSTTSTLNKASYHSLTRWCGILQLPLDIIWVEQKN
jgi:hypothetical protein